MVNLEMTMDDKSLEIRRDGKPIGHVLWHREQCVVLDQSFTELAFSEMEYIIGYTKAWRERTKR